MVRLLIAAIPLLALLACARDRGVGAERLTERVANRELGCTPLGVVIRQSDQQGVGSGVLVHPRILLTASHITPPDPRSVALFAVGGDTAETVGVVRTVRGRAGDSFAQDWALLVLERPLARITADPAPLPATAMTPAPGQALLVAGFAMENESPLERAPLLLRTACIARPAGPPPDPGVIYARNTRRYASRRGASGGPVLQPMETGPVLVGLYLGTTERWAAGVLLGRELSIHLAPLGEIRALAAELDKAP